MKRIFLLILATFIWGLGFVGTRWTFMDYSDVWSNTLRFIFAGALVLPFVLFRPKVLFDKGAFICALALAVALQLQTVGIGLTSLAKSGFLTAAYALFTPILALAFFKIKIRSTFWGLLTFAFLGIAMICEFSLSQFNVGDLYILVSALFFSLHILAIDKFAQKKSAILFNFAQIVYIGILCTGFAFVVEGPVSLAPLFELEALFTISSLWGFIILSVFSSIIAFSLQVYSQQGIAPHIVSLIFLLESIFATLFGYLFFKETLSPLSMAGCVLVVSTVALIPKLTSFNKNKKKPKTRKRLIFKTSV